MIDENSKKFTHPSYGLVGFSRVSCGGRGMRLFGSAVRSGNVIRLSILRAEREHHLNQDWYHGRKELIDVYLSPSQFADLLTTMNVGMGIPCTILNVAGVSQGCPPEDVLSEAELVQEEIIGHSKTLGDKLVKAAAEVKNIIDKSKMSKRDKEDVACAMRGFMQEVHSNLPFLISQLREAAERVVSQLKTEAVAFVDQLLRHNHLENKKNEAPQIDMEERK